MGLIDVGDMQFHRRPESFTLSWSKQETKIKVQYWNIYLACRNGSIVIIKCNVKGISHSDEPTENYHLTLQFPSALWNFFFRIFRLITSAFTAHNFAVSIHFHRCHQLRFHTQWQLFLEKKALKIHCALSTKQQTDKVKQWAEDIVKHLVAKESDISVRSWWRPK